MSESGRSSSCRILVVDDDPSLAEMLQIMLRTENLDTIWCGHGDRAIALFHQTRPDLVLLDLMLPGRNGFDVCRDIRAESGVPIIMLTARSDTNDIVRGLEVGADDYISKPFNRKELVARIRARLRRQGPEGEASSVQIADLDIDVTSHSVRRGAEEIVLTPLEFDLLATLARHPGVVFTRERLLADVWGYRQAGDTRLVNVHVQRLRAKIERDPERPSIIVTVRGVGYRAGRAQPAASS
ncbi:MtrAB system response regulator MtrA [Propionibacterium cyclohexanicum]|nr:MtrAB system response regulator MtrA [Propionibacterium cyclohexanicum]